MKRLIQRAAGTGAGGTDAQLVAAAAGSVSMRMTPYGRTRYEF